MAQARSGTFEGRLRIGIFLLNLHIFLFQPAQRSDESGDDVKSLWPV